MSNIYDDEDASYLEIPKPEEDREKVWCKIGDDGGLEYINWEVVTRLAGDFDLNRPEHRTEQMLIAKLMILVRDETRKECGYDNR